jgi:hypothetical protein
VFTRASTLVAAALAVFTEAARIDASLDNTPEIALSADCKPFVLTFPTERADTLVKTNVERTDTCWLTVLTLASTEVAAAEAVLA